MLHPSTKRLIDKLNDMTRKQRVAWTEGENATVVHDTEGYRVVLTPEPHAVLLTDAVGREIETCLPEEFADEVDAHGRPYSKFVAELYREASRHARGTEKAISTLLAGLDAAAAEPEPEPAIALSDAVTDETAPIESETEITAAVATLADKINAPAAAATVPEEISEAAPQPDEQESQPDAETAAEPEPDVAAGAVPEPEPGLIAEPAEQDAESQMEPAPPAPAVEVAPLADEPGSFGTFGTFQSASPAPEAEAAPEPEPEPEPEPVHEVAAETPPRAPEPQPVAPEPEPAPAAGPTVPRLTQPISLSAIPFGFGLGAAQRTGVAPPEPKPAPSQEVQTDAAARIVIDGTLDLPETLATENHDDSSAEPYPPPEPTAGPQDIPGDSTRRPEPGNPRRFNPWN